MAGDVGPGCCGGGCGGPGAATAAMSGGGVFEEGVFPAGSDGLGNGVEFTHRAEVDYRNYELHPNSGGGSGRYDQRVRFTVEWPDRARGRSCRCG